MDGILFYIWTSPPPSLLLLIVLGNKKKTISIVCNKPQLTIRKVVITTHSIGMTVYTRTLEKVYFCGRHLPPSTVAITRTLIVSYKKSRFESVLVINLSLE